MKKLIMVLTAVVLVAVGILAQAAPAAACCGLTPGYWKNHTNVWVKYAPTQTLESVFDVPNSLGLDNFTLLQALQFGGGKGNIGAAKILCRAATAALLNSTKFSYEYSTSQVIEYTNDALGDLNRDYMIWLAGRFDYWNNYQAPPGY